MLDEHPQWLDALRAWPSAPIMQRVMETLRGSWLIRTSAPRDLHKPPRARRRAGDGSGDRVDPLHAELTTRQAADLLQVPRTHLVQLLSQGRIPYRKVGAHRRVRTEDVLAYRRETESRRREALDELTTRDQELGLQ